MPFKNVNEVTGSQGSWHWVIICFCSQLGAVLLPAENWGWLNLFSESCINVWSGDQAWDICFLQKPFKCYFRASDPETLKKKLCFCSKNLCPLLKKTKINQQTSLSSLPLTKPYSPNLEADTQKMRSGKWKNLKCCPWREWYCLQNKVFKSWRFLWKTPRNQNERTCILYSVSLISCPRQQSWSLGVYVQMEQTY